MKRTMFGCIRKVSCGRLSLGARWRSTTSYVGKRVESSDELDAIFAKPSWSTSELLTQEEKPVEVTSAMLNALLELSGLSKSVSQDEKSAIVKSLTEQLNFIRKLHNVELQGTRDLSRLVDDNSVRPLTFESLMENINTTTRSLSKGEIENSWTPISLASQHQNKYFLVKEGLLKKNK